MSQSQGRLRPVNINLFNDPVSSSDEGVETPISGFSTPLFTHQPLCRLKRYSSTPILQHLSRSAMDESSGGVHIPIVGYEVMEERARFTVYKLKINNDPLGECWFVFRRYTDFVRLHAKLKSEFPMVPLPMPRKRWFGNNFESRFIEQRMKGLQHFIDEITRRDQLMKSITVRQFFCLDQPPNFVEDSEENRVMFEALEETIYHLRLQLSAKENEYEALKMNFIQSQQKMRDFENHVRDKCCDNCRDLLLKSFYVKTSSSSELIVSEPQSPSSSSISSFPSPESSRF